MNRISRKARRIHPFEQACFLIAGTLIALTFPVRELTAIILYLYVLPGLLILLVALPRLRQLDRRLRQASRERAAALIEEHRIPRVVK